MSNSEIALPHQICLLFRVGINFHKRQVVVYSSLTLCHLKSARNDSGGIWQMLYKTRCKYLQRFACGTLHSMHCLLRRCAILLRLRGQGLPMSLGSRRSGFWRS